MSNKVPSGWKECKLAEVVCLNQHSIGSTYEYQNIVYLDTGSITKGRITDIKEYKLSEAPSRAKRPVKHNDIVYSTVRPIQRHYGIINNPPDNMLVSTGFVVIEVIESLVDPFFIYYFLTLDEIVEVLDIIAEASTSAYPSFRPSDLENLNILLPPLPEQRAIASVLSSLDDKIDLLHRENKTLEAIAETLFRQWFIEEADEGWEEKSLKNIYIFEKGFEPGSGNYLETKEKDTIRFIRVGDMLSYTPSVYIKKSLAQNICTVDDLLMSFDGTPGRLNFGIEGAYSSGIRRIYSLNPLYDNLGLKYLIFKSKHIQDMINAHSSGTVILHASSSIDELTFSFPDERMLEEFNKLITPIFSKIQLNKRQFLILERLRDTLLPKLMSGEVRVKYEEEEMGSCQE